MPVVGTPFGKFTAAFFVATVKSHININQFSRATITQHLRIGWQELERCSHIAVAICGLLSGQLHPLANLFTRSIFVDIAFFVAVDLFSPLRGGFAGGVQQRGMLTLIGHNPEKQLARGGKPFPDSFGFFFFHIRNDHFHFVRTESANHNFANAGRVNSFLQHRNDFLNRDLILSGNARLLIHLADNRYTTTQINAELQRLVGDHDRAG